MVAWLFLADSLRAADQPRPWGDWPQWGDQGDGTYNNPVIPADYSDLDCIRVGPVSLALIGCCKSRGPAT